MPLMNKRREHLGRIYKLQVCSVQGMIKRYREEDMKLFVHWCNKKASMIKVQFCKSLIVNSEFGMALHEE